MTLTTTFQAFRGRRPVVTGGLEALMRTLDRAPAPVELWWRDDDAGRKHWRLDLLLELAGRLDVPVALSVVPAWLEPAVLERIRRCPRATVLQHGWSHENYASLGNMPVELGGKASAAAVLIMLREGRRRLEQHFGRQFQPVLVPPWHSLDEHAIHAIDLIGYRAVSLAPYAPGKGLLTPRLDVQVDVMTWVNHLSRVPSLVRLAGSLHRSRTADEVALDIAGLIERGEGGPIGLLTHHLTLAPEDFRMIETIVRTIRDHPNARWRAVTEILAPVAEPTASGIRPRGTVPTVLARTEEVLAI